MKIPMISPPACSLRAPIFTICTIFGWPVKNSIDGGRVLELCCALWLCVKASNSLRFRLDFFVPIEYRRHCSSCRSLPAHAAFTLALRSKGGPANLDDLQCLRRDAPILLTVFYVGLFPNIGFGYVRIFKLNHHSIVRRG